MAPIGARLRGGTGDQRQAATPQEQTDDQPKDDAPSLVAEEHDVDAPLARRSSESIKCPSTRGELLTQPPGHSVEGDARPGRL